MNWLLQLPLYVQVFLASAAGTAFISFVFKIVEMWIQNSIQRSNEKYKDKKQLAEEVIKICTEAKLRNFTVHPRDHEHIHFIAEKVLMENENAGVLMNDILSKWQLCAAHHNPINRDRLVGERLEFVMGLQKEAREKIQKLLKIVRKWEK